MIDQSLVQSGFDAEVLLSGRYIQYLLLNAVETGSLQTDLLIPIETDNGTTHLDIKLYLPEDYARVYEPNPMANLPNRISPSSFHVDILVDDPGGTDLRITMVADIHDVQSGQGMDEAVIELYTTFQLLVETDENGNQRNAQMRIELLSVEGIIIDLAIALFGITREEIVAKMKPEFDRSIDLGLVGANQNVQSVQMQKLVGVDAQQNAVCIYVNLKLKDGPEAESFVAERGDLLNAQNFLNDGQDIAFGMPGNLYAKLANDAFQKMAEETSEGSGVFTYPIHETPNDPESDVKGKIHGVSMYAQNGQLVIDVSGQYFVDTPIIDIVPDPEFNFLIYIKPEIKDGLIEWKFDYDLEIGPLYKVISIFLAVLLGIIFGPGGLIAGGILALAVIGGQELIAEPIALGMIEDQADGLVDASFFDAIPSRLTVETRRWDPFYKTHHQIVAQTDAVQITPLGIGFSGVAILDKEAEPISNVVIRTEQKDAEWNIEELWYRVSDFAASANDFTSIFPATDRLAYRKVENDVETNLFALTIPNCTERIPALKLLPLIPYTAQKVQIVKNQVDHILAISNREVRDLTNSLDGDEAAISAAVNSLVRFDLPPEKMAALQQAKIMFLNGFVVVNRQGKPYYRDRADGNLADNLMSLPRYTPDN